MRTTFRKQAATIDRKTESQKELMQERSMCDQQLHKLAKVQNIAHKAGIVKSQGITAI